MIVGERILEISGNKVPGQKVEGLGINISIESVEKQKDTIEVTYVYTASYQEKAGEINMPVSRGEYSTDEVYATLGEIIAGRKKGRTDDKTITVFDSTGIAIEDLAVAKLVYEKARQGGSYYSTDFIKG